MVQSSNNIEETLKTDQHQNSITHNQEQLISSTSSASTIIAGNETTSTPSSTNLPGSSDIKSSNTGPVETNTVEDVKQENITTITREGGSSNKVRNKIFTVLVANR